MKLSIISPTSSQVMDIEWISVQTPSGNFVVKHGHAPIVTALKSNSKISYAKDDGSITTTEIPDGLINIQRDNVLILITNE